MDHGVPVIVRDRDFRHFAAHMNLVLSGARRSAKAHGNRPGVHWVEPGDCSSGAGKTFVMESRN